MRNAFKVFNKVLRVIFIGFIAVVAVAKLFEKDKNEKAIEEVKKEYVTSEFDEIW